MCLWCVGAAALAADTLKVAIHVNPHIPNECLASSQPMVPGKRSAGNVCGIRASQVLIGKVPDPGN